MMSTTELKHVCKWAKGRFGKITFVFLIASVLFGFIGTVFLHLSIVHMAFLFVLAFFLACLEIVIYLQEDKLSLTLCYVSKLILICVFVYVLHELYVPVANEPYVTWIKTFLDAIGNKSDTFMNGVLAQFACIIVFERVLSWMKAPVCPEWNPFYVGDLQIHKVASFVLTTAYFAYFSYGTLGYSTYLPIAEKIALLCVLISIFWVQYPFENKGIPKAVTKYIKRTAHLYYTADELHKEHVQIEDGDVNSSDWNQYVCMPLFRKVYRLMTYKYSVVHFGEKFEVISSLLNHLGAIYDSSISAASAQQNVRSNSAKNAVSAESSEKTVKDNQNIVNTEAWVLAYIIGCGCAVSDGQSYFNWINGDFSVSLELIGNGRIVEAFKMGVVYGLEAWLGKARKETSTLLHIPDIDERAVPPEYKPYFDYMKKQPRLGAEKPNDNFSMFLGKFYKELANYNEKCHTVATINQGKSDKGGAE